MSLSSRFSHDLQKRSRPGCDRINGSQSAVLEYAAFAKGVSMSCRFADGAAGSAALQDLVTL